MMSKQDNSRGNSRANSRVGNMMSQGCTKAEEATLWCCSVDKIRQSTACLDHNNNNSVVCTVTWIR